MHASQLKTLLAPLAFAALAACGGTSTYVAYPQPQAYVAPSTSYVVQPTETVVNPPTTTYVVPSETVVTTPSTTTYIVTPPPQPAVRACPWGTYTC